MRSIDKFLLIFVALIAVLVVVALVVEGNRAELTYRQGVLPEDAAFNYLLALQKKDYERAYAYLSPSLSGYPADQAEFERDIRRNSYMFSTDDERESFSILAAETAGDQATVEVRESTFYRGDLFSAGRVDSTFDLELELQDDAWKIVDGDDSFFYCWTQTRCP